MWNWLKFWGLMMWLLMFVICLRVSSCFWSLLIMKWCRFFFMSWISSCWSCLKIVSICCIVIGVWWVGCMLGIWSWKGMIMLKCMCLFFDYFFWFLFLFFVRVWLVSWLDFWRIVGCFCLGFSGCSCFFVLLVLVNWVGGCGNWVGRSFLRWLIFLSGDYFCRCWSWVWGLVCWVGIVWLWLVIYLVCWKNCFWKYCGVWVCWCCS